MSKLEKISGTVDRQLFHVVKKTPDASAEEETAEPSLSVPPPITVPPSQARTTPTLQSFDRFRRAKSQEAVGQTILSALPAPYVASKTDPVCPACKGVGFTRKDVPYGHPAFGKPIPCQCIMKKRASQAGVAQIPEAFQALSFASYLEQRLDPQQELVAMQVMHFTMERLTGSNPSFKHGLYLSGPLGVGKTGLAIAALREAITAGKSGLYLSTSFLLDMLRESIAASQRLARGYGDEEDKQEESAGAKVLRLVETVDWLVLDDLGVECGTEFVVNRLYRIIEGRRLQRNLSTIFTSNKTAAGLEQRWRPAKGGTGAFDDCYRVIDRLGEYCVMVSMVGRNLRQK